jgi:hypothetical protein
LDAKKDQRKQKGPKRTKRNKGKSEKGGMRAISVEGRNSLCPLSPVRCSLLFCFFHFPFSIFIWPRPARRSRPRPPILVAAKPPGAFVCAYADPTYRASALDCVRGSRRSCALPAFFFGDGLGRAGKEGGWGGEGEVPRCTNCAGGLVCGHKSKKK